MCKATRMNGRMKIDVVCLSKGHIYATLRTLNIYAFHFVQNGIIRPSASSWESSPFVPGIFSTRGAFLGTVAIWGLSDRMIGDKGSK